MAHQISGENKRFHCKTGEFNFFFLVKNFSELKKRKEKRLLSFRDSDKVISKIWKFHVYIKKFHDVIFEKLKLSRE